MMHVPDVIRVSGSPVGHVPAFGRPWGRWTVCGRMEVEAAIERQFRLYLNDPAMTIWARPSEVDRPCGHCVRTINERRRTQDAQIAAMSVAAAKEDR